MRRCPPGAAGRCNPVPLHVPLSGALCFVDACWSSEPLSPTTAQEGTTGLGTSVATEPPGVAGQSRGVHIRCSGARSHPVYAYWRFYNAYVPLPSYRLVLVIKFCRFSSVDVQSFAPQLLNIILAKIGVQNSPERTAENDFLMRWVCASSRHCVLVPDEYLSQVCESYHHGETSVCRRVRYRASEARRYPLQSPSKPEQPEL